MKLPRSQNQCPHFSTKPCDRPRSENHCPPTDGLGSFEMNGHQDSGTACDASRQGEIPMEFTLPKLYYWRDLLSARIWPVFFGRYDLGCLAHRAAETYRWPKRFSIDLDPSLWSKRPLIAAIWYPSEGTMFKASFSNEKNFQGRTIFFTRWNGSSWNQGIQWFTIYYDGCWWQHFEGFWGFSPVKIINSYGSPK